MCEDCGASGMADRSTAADVVVVSWMRRSEEGERDLKCSCCGVVLESGFYSPYWVFKPSSKEDLGCEEVGGVENCSGCLMGGEELIDSENIKLSSVVTDDHEDGEDGCRDYDGYKLVEKDDAAVDVEIISEEEEEEEKMALLSTMEINDSQAVASVDVVEEEYPQPIIAVSVEGIDAQVEEELEHENYGEFQGNSSVNLSLDEFFGLIYVLLCSDVIMNLYLVDHCSFGGR